MYVCRASDGSWYRASDYLEAALSREDVRSPVNVAEAIEVKTGTNGMGLRWASATGCRLVAYAQGGYCCQRWVKGQGWCLFCRDEDMDQDLCRALCCALGIEYVP